MNLFCKSCAVQYLGRLLPKILTVTWNSNLTEHSVNLFTKSSSPSHKTSPDLMVRETDIHSWGENSEKEGICYAYACRLSTLQGDGGPWKISNKWRQYKMEGKARHFAVWVSSWLCHLLTMWSQASYFRSVILEWARSFIAKVEILVVCFSSWKIGRILLKDENEVIDISETHDNVRN